MSEYIMNRENRTVNIIGAGLAGLSAALTLAERGIHTRLISVQASERAQSNLAEGGINAVLNVMGENDTKEEHARDTEAGGCFLADPNMIRRMTVDAPRIVEHLTRLGVPFHQEDGHVIQRNFGGQKKKRTAYAKSSTGKVMTAAMIDAVRKQEAAGTVERLAHHAFEKLVLENAVCRGVQVYDVYRKESVVFPGIVIMACGGMNGMFGGSTTGTTANTGSAAAELFAQGVKFANLEFLQYHPTTTAITGKRMLISEAARGEGGRLFYYGSGGEKCYFMEEAYGDRGNLMPRDVISREMARLGSPVYLDLCGLPDPVWKMRLSDLREEIIHYQGIDPAKEPVPVAPGIHFFMGGIYVDENHRTNVEHLLAAGECAAAYHGANRLGGNSLLGAIHGGRIAAESAAEELDGMVANAGRIHGLSESVESIREQTGKEEKAMNERQPAAFSRMTQQERIPETEMEAALLQGLGILRDEENIRKALLKVKCLEENVKSDEMRARILLAEAMLLSADARRESRGAHTRLDYPKTDESYRRTTVVRYEGDEIRVTFDEIPAMRSK